MFVVAEDIVVASAGVVDIRLLAVFSLVFVTQSVNETAKVLASRQRCKIDRGVDSHDCYHCEVCKPTSVDNRRTSSTQYGINIAANNCVFKFFFAVDKKK